MNTAQDPDRTLATCYLEESGHEQHKIWLSREHLQLLYKGKHRVFDLKDVQKLAFNHRKLMLPLVAGGISASLSLVAIFRAYYNPWLMLTLLVVGLAGVYLGYQGSWALTVQEHKYHHDFFLSQISPNLRAFVAYANSFCGRQTPGLVYLPMSLQDWQQVEEGESLQLQQKQRLYFKQEIGSLPSHLTVVLPLNSLDESFRIQWEPDEQGALYPCLPAGTSIPLQQHRPFFRQPSV